MSTISSFGHSHVAPIILDRSEIERMKLSVMEIPPDNSKQIKRAQLKKLSQDRLQHWPNTLEALRKKKENFLKDKADEEERKRQEIDKMEAEVRRQQRLDCIERANSMLYEQTDKMKLLRSQQLYADVLVTRKEQMEHKKKVKEDEKIEAAKYHKFIVEKVSQLEAIEQEKIDKRKAMVKVIAKSREEQLAEVHAQRAAEKAEAIAIGIAMKKQAQERVEEEIRLAEAKIIAAADNNAAMVIANEKLKAVRKDIIEKETIAMKEREGEVEIIENRAKARKAIELRRFEKAQEQKQKLIDAATKQLMMKANTEEKLLNKQIAEQRAKEDNAIAAKEAKLKKQRDDIDESRRWQLEARERERQETMMMEEKLIQLRIKANEEAEADAQAKAKVAHDITVSMKKSQFEDGVRAAKKRLEDRILAIEQDKLLKELDKADDVKFSNIVKQEIKSYAAAGKSIYPMLRALNYTQPELLAAKKPTKEEMERKKQAEARNG